MNLNDWMFMNRKTIRGHHHKITDLVINTNNSVLMSSSEDGWVMFWDITPLTQSSTTTTSTTTTGQGQAGGQSSNDSPCKPLYRFLACCRGHRQYVAQLHYDPITDLLFSVADDGLVIAWNVALIDPLQHTIQRPMTEREMMVITFSHDRKVYNPMQMYQDALPKANPALFCDINKTGEFLAVGTHNGSVYIWKIPVIVRNELGFTSSVRIFHHMFVITDKSTMKLVYI